MIKSRRKRHSINVKRNSHCNKSPRNILFFTLQSIYYHNLTRFVKGVVVLSSKYIFLFEIYLLLFSHKHPASTLIFSTVCSAQSGFFKGGHFEPPLRPPKGTVSPQRTVSHFLNSQHIVSIGGRAAVLPKMRFFADQLRFLQILGGSLNRAAGYRQIRCHPIDSRSCFALSILPVKQIEIDELCPMGKARRFHTTYRNTAYTLPAHSVRKGLAGFDRSITQLIS